MVSREPEATVASPFQVGLRCPVCQGAIATGDALLSCRACASAHHAACWTQRGHCASYHCDPSTQAPAGRAPEIVVTLEEAARVTVPPPRIPTSSADVAARLKQDAGPPRWSPGAVIATAAAFVLLGVAVLSFFGGDHLSGAGPFLALGGMLGSFIIGLSCALAAASVFRDRARKGMILALGGVLVCVASAGLSIATIMRFSGPEGARHSGAPFTLADPEPPAPETFERAPPPIANAMRANVFVAGRSAGVLERAWCGAGVILGTRTGTTYILTNKHVIEGGGGSAQGQELSLKFANGEVAQATVEWTAPEGVDLGILSCRIMRPPRVSTCLRKGPPQVSDRVFAIGNPHELSWTYTEGAVSRVHEKHAPSGAGLEVIQTQTPIQPGNSGGGLYDAQGRLAGINTWVVDSANGPGFAISTKTVLAQVPSRFAEVASTDDAAPDEERPR